VADAALGESGPEEMALVGRAVVGHDTLDPDAVTGEEAESPLQERVGKALEARGFVVQPPGWAIGGSDPSKDGCTLGF
jgi:hypothetical protein